MRVAWLGPAPTDEYGVEYAATQLLRGLARNGVEIDCYFTVTEGEIPDALRAEPNIRLLTHQNSWEWDRWYSRHEMAAFVTRNAARALGQIHLTRAIVASARIRPYDCLYQFSQIESFALRRLRRHIPALVVHPQVHAAGELRWYRKERPLGRACEPATKRALAEAVLIARSSKQRRDIQLADAIVAASSRFSEHLSNDYGVLRERFHVIPNPVDLDRFQPVRATPTNGRRRFTLLFASRMSVRKGLDLVVDLSHRLADLQDRVRIVVAGGHTLWSDYRPLLTSLNASVAEYVGWVAPRDLPALYRSADVCLQPSQYEPFALTVGEALACGVPAVVSDEVGAGERVDSRCCHVFPAGDMAAFEAVVRHVVGRLEPDRRAEIQRLARSEAERLFAPEKVSRQVADMIATVAARIPESSARAA